jgi:hypothetical protein
MAKTCILCGYSPDIPAKPAGQTENCPKCHGKDTVQEVEEQDEEE